MVMWGKNVSKRKGPEKHKKAEKPGMHYEIRSQYLLTGEGIFHTDDQQMVLGIDTRYSCWGPDSRHVDILSVRQVLSCYIYLQHG
jgi:hypothetical protein